MSDSHLYIGMISGTSVDGIDCALVDFSANYPKLLAAHCEPYPAALRRDILRLCEGENLTLSQYGKAHIEIGRCFARAALDLLANTGTSAEQIAAIGSHGQTIWHEPGTPHPFTLQIGDPNTIAQQTGITTVADLRGRDMAAGGQGAPLAPLLHRSIFHSQNVDRAVINIGGISNVTSLPRNKEFLAFDTGPGNVLMDYWINKHHAREFDKNGEWAASGQFNLALLNALLDEPYFREPIPKSTGRELFNGAWLERKISACGTSIAPEDVQATLLTLTVTTIVSALDAICTPQEIYVCGGGAHNATLMSELGKVASDISVASTAELGVDPDWVEAMAFAWMAQETLSNRPIDTRAFTGAKLPVILGGIYRSNSA